MPRPALRRQSCALACAEQGRILPIGDEAALVDSPRTNQLDASNDHLKAKISSAEQMNVHTMLVIGHRDLEANAVNGLEIRAGKPAVGIGNVQRKTIEWHEFNGEGPVSEFTAEPSESDSFHANGVRPSRLS